MSNVATQQKPQLVADAPVSSADEVQRAKSGSKTLLIIAGIGVMTAATLFGYLRLTAGEQTTDDAAIDADVVPIAVRVSGSIASLAVKDESHVKKGAIILELDSAELAARLKQAEGELLAAKADALAADAQQHVTEASARGGLTTSQAQVFTSRAQVSSATAQISTAQAQLARAEAEAKLAELDVSNAEQLFASNAVSRTRLDSAQAEHATAQAAVAAARAQLASSEETRRVAEGRVTEAAGALDANRPIEAKIAAATGAAQRASARVGIAEAAVELARLALSYATVRAPIDGTVSRLNVREGQLLSANQAVASIVPDVNYVVANFKETQVGAMQPGQQVSIEVDALPGQKLHGVVASLAAGTGSRFSLLPADNASGNFVKVVQRVPVHIDWTNLPSHVALRAGMSATVTVHTGG
jgi:membrane fusion protein (multidrug efflux system)